MKRSSENETRPVRAGAETSEARFHRAGHVENVPHDFCCARHVENVPHGRYRYVRLRWRVAFAVIDFVGSAVFKWAAAVRRLLWGRKRAEQPDPNAAKPQPNRRTDLWSVATDQRSVLRTCAHDAQMFAQKVPKTILLVQLDHLGDAIITTSILPALRSRYPDASIEVLAGAWNREVFEACPEVDRVHVSQVNRFARGGLKRFAWIPATFWWGLRLRRRRVDLGIDVRGEFPLALILWLCGARRRVGWDCGGGGFLLTDRADFVPGRPEVLSRWALLEKLDIKRPDEFDAWRPRFRRRFPTQSSRLAPRDEASSCGAKWLQDEASSCEARWLPTPLVVLHVGAGTEAKRWPALHWRELLGRILVGRDARVVLVGGEKDRTIARTILGGRCWPGVVDRTGRLSIGELAALLERADVFVGADSGPAHLAAAVDTPVVVLFSGTNDPRQWRPCGRQVAVVRHEVDCSPCHRERCPMPGHPCMSRLDPERVAVEVEGVLNAASHGRVTSGAVDGDLGLTPPNAVGGRWDGLKK